MAAGEAGVNFTEFVLGLPPNILNNFNTLMTIFKAVGIMALIYFVYLIFIAIISFRRRKLLKHIERKIDSVDRKLDKLLKKKK